LYSSWLQVESAIQRIAVKEKRSGDRKPQWHVQTGLAGLLRGEVVSLPPDIVEKVDTSRKLRVRACALTAR
jgi:hypothetical protein